MKIHSLIILALALIGGAALGQDGASPFAFVQRIEHKLVMELKSSESPPYQVLLISEDGRKRSRFVEIGQSFFDGDRFVATKLVPKFKTDNTDVSELTVKDALLRKEIVLVLRVPQNLGADEAEFRMKGGVESFKVRKGEVFVPPHQLSPSYQLMDVQVDSATVVLLKADGTRDKEITIGRQ